MEQKYTFIQKTASAKAELKTTEAIDKRDYKTTPVKSVSESKTIHQLIITKTKHA